MCQELYVHAKGKIDRLMETFSGFSQLCCMNSALCRYWDGIIKLSNMLKDKVAADREGNWLGHLQAVQNLLPVFCDPVALIICDMAHGT